MNPDTKLEEAILFAVNAHFGHKDVHGLPYVLHVLRVMNRVRRAGGNETAMIVALLHDVLKDTKASPAQIDCVFGHQVLDSVRILTRQPKVNYKRYLALIANNKNREITVMVKLADIADNLQRGKDNPLPEPKQAQLNTKYLAAQKFLRGDK